MSSLNIEKVTELPETHKPNSLYLLKEGNKVTLHFTDSAGEEVYSLLPVMSGDDVGKVLAVDANGELTLVDVMGPVNTLISRVDDLTTRVENLENV